MDQSQQEDVSPTGKASFFKNMQNQTSGLMKSASSSVRNAIDVVQKKIEDHLKEPSIIIQVCDPMTKDSGLQKHTVFNLKGSDRIGLFDVYRRFNDFHEIREFLTLSWPGCMIPPIPEKQMYQGNDVQVVQERKRQLDYFCKSVAKIPFIYYSSDFCQLFLRGSGTDISKQITHLPKPTSTDILEKFQETFKTLEFNENNGQNVMFISTHQGSLKKNITYLKSYVEQGYSLSVSRRLLNENKVKLFTTLLPDYETQCLLEYYGGKESKLIIGNLNNASLDQAIQTLRDVNMENPLNLIYDLMKIELRECEALLLTINQREQYISQKAKLEQKVRDDQYALISLAEGKKNLSTISSVMKNKDEAQLKIEQRIILSQKEVDNITQLIDIMTAVLANQEIPNYKLWRIQHYRQTFKEIQAQEASTIQSEQMLWEQIKVLTQSDVNM